MSENNPSFNNKVNDTRDSSKIQLFDLALQGQF